MNEEIAQAPIVTGNYLNIVVEGIKDNFEISLLEPGCQTNLARGGYAFVYVAHDKQGRKLALKTLKVPREYHDYEDEERVNRQIHFKAPCLMALLAIY